MMKEIFKKEEENFSYKMSLSITKIKNDFNNQAINYFLFNLSFLESSE